MSTPSTFNINLGPIVSALFSSLSFLSLDFVKVVPADCYFPFAFIQSMVSTTLLPVFASIIVFSAFAFQRIQLFYKEKNRLRRREKVKRLFVRYFALFVMITYMVLPSTTAKIFKIFNCIDVDPDHYDKTGAAHRFLLVDYAVDCDSANYKFGLSWAYIMILVYPIGLPSMFFTLLFVNRSEIRLRGLKQRENTFLDSLVDMSEEDRADHMKMFEKKKDRDNRKPSNGLVDALGFLFEAYKPEYWCVLSASVHAHIHTRTYT